MTFKVSVRWPITEQQLLDAFPGQKITPAARSIAKLMPQLSRDELEEFYRWAILEELVHGNHDPETRHELLNMMDSCPCCDHWLGHNNPPPDDPPVARQKKTPLSPLPTVKTFKP